MVYLDSHEAEIFNNLFADCGVIFAYSGCEYNRVNSAHCSCICADKLCNAVDEHIKSKLCALIAFVSCCRQVAEVAAYAGDSENARLFIHQIVNFFCRHFFIFHKKSNDSRIHRTCSCTHNNAVKRSEAHGCIHAFAAVNGCYR